MFYANFLTIDSSTRRLKIHKKVALFLRSPINDAYAGQVRLLGKELLGYRATRGADTL